jgi:hypothetical protein
MKKVATRRKIDVVTQIDLPKPNAAATTSLKN